MKLSEELEKRGFVHQFVGESLKEVVDSEKRVVYHGIDPTADSAHIGNFVSWLLLKHLAKAGHKIIFLVGGGTGMIGDPKPDVERSLLTPEQVSKNVEGLQKQAQKVFGDIEVTFVNNADWLTELKLIDFLREVGKHFTVNELVKKDAIASRLNREDGISYTEFAYPLLQGFDYLQLHRQYGCDLQVSGSDQWGNIVAGVELIRRKEGKKVYALTSPIVVDKSTGKKFGKSEGNAVWLDSQKTSPYQFYQFWLNVSDESVIDYLKMFTFLSMEEIGEIERANLSDPSARVAQHKLAREVTTLVHGKEQADVAEHVTGVLFGETDPGLLSEAERATLIDNAPNTNVELETPLVDVLVDTGLATSKREARMFIESGAITVANEKIHDITSVISEDIFINGVALLRRGKKQVVVLRLK
jgi:tyrosyl-tRNA synthetase